MSNKKYRTPAVVPDAEWSSEPDADSPADSSTSSVQASSADSGQASSADSGQARSEAPAQTEPPEPVGGIPIQILPDDYLEHGFHGAKPVPPGVYRTAPNAGTGVVDLRSRFGAINPSPYERKPLTEAEIALYNGDAMRFLWQVVAITSQILESVQLGDLRRVVASDIAEPGDIVREDGTVSKYPDAFRVGEDGNEAGARMRATKPSAPPETEAEQAETEKRKSAGRARGRTHPLIALIRMAIQSSRLIRQFTVSTYAKLDDRLKERQAEVFEALERAENWLNSLKE